jgi:aminopeptidase YwaD
VKSSLLLLAIASLSLSAETPIVHPEQVKAHEDFLAGDALQGRGSATRDEWIAATYIASEFESYGLRPPPNSTGYVQTIGLESLRPDGKAQLKIGKRILREGTDFYLATSSGRGMTGSLQIVGVDSVRNAQPAKDAAILVRGEADRSVQRALSGLMNQGAGLVLYEATKVQLDAFAKGARTRVATRIKGLPETAVRPTGTAIYLLPGALPRLKKVKNGNIVTLTVHSSPVTKSTYNAMALLPGTDASGGTILITAHLDHLGIRDAASGDNIYNGADDDASGVTAVLEIARALAATPAPRRSVLFVCFGSEEAGGYGARWFREKPPVPLKDIAANLEFEMIGVQQEKVPRGTMFLTGWDRSNLGPTLKEHGALLSPDPFPDRNFFERSDNYALALKGVVAHTAAAGGEVPTYHQANDDVEHIDIALMTQLIQSMIEPLRWLANSDFKPAWNPGGQPHGN